MFGKSVFQSVLDRLQDEEDDESPAADDAPAIQAVRGLNGGFVANIQPSRLGESTSITQAYYETASDEMLAPTKPVPPPVMPDHLHRTAPGQIAEDLALDATESVATLTDKRRRFAAANHPDRHDPLFRQQATTRMKIANMMIDEAMRRVPRP